MREILFRGKRADNGEWVEGNLTVWNDGNASIDDGPTIPSPLYEVYPESVGQYTGLTDKNGTKIFEGDIIDTPDRLVKIVWFEGNAQFDLHFIRYKDEIAITNFKGMHMRDLKEYEVIGNIYDNKEILDVK